MSERTEERSPVDDAAAEAAPTDEEVGLEESAIGAGSDAAADAVPGAGTDPDLAAGRADEDRGAVDEADAETERERGGRLPSVSGRLTGAFSVGHFLLALALSVGAGLALGSVVPWPRLGNFAGVFLAGAAVGLVASGRHYLEVTAAGALAAGAAMFLGSVLASLLTLGAQPAFGVGAGAILAFLGHYAGRDLRAGLTREL